MKGDRLGYRERTPYNTVWGTAGGPPQATENGPPTRTVPPRDLAPLRNWVPDDYVVPPRGQTLTWRDHYVVPPRNQVPHLFKLPRRKSVSNRPAMTSCPLLAGIQTPAPQYYPPASPLLALSPPLQTRLPFPHFFHFNPQAPYFFPGFITPHVPPSNTIPVANNNNS